MGCRNCGCSTPGWMGWDTVCTSCQVKLQEEYYNSQEYKNKVEEESKRWSCHIYGAAYYTREEGCFKCKYPD